MVIAISEGTSGGINEDAARRKYAELMALIERALNRPVAFTFVREFDLLVLGMKTRQFDVVMARPSDYPARGLRDYGYRLVATAEPAGHCELIVPKTSPLKSVKDLRGKYFILPEQKAYMTSFCLAALREEGIQVDLANIYFVREQDAIPFGLERGMADVGGVASYSGVYRRWVKSGHRVLYESRPQPYFPVIASQSVDEHSLQAIRQVLTSLHTSTEGQTVLASLGISGFAISEEQRLRQLLDWLGVGKGVQSNP